jgi:NAD(P)-dependent dehydrogenase (short-subunit alcohol dehydrogenase family)
MMQYLVTGASKGIGLALSKAIARAGHTVILTARTQEKADAACTLLQEEHPDLTEHWKPLALDILNPKSRASALEWLQTHAKLDGLINNAGVLYAQATEAVKADTSMMAVSSNTLLATLNTNALCQLYWTQECLPLLRQSSSPQILFVSSGWGQHDGMEGGYPAAYKLSKACLNFMGDMLAHELKPEGIRVNMVCPGWVHTEMGGPSAPRSPEQAAKGILALLESKQPEHHTGGFYRDLEPLNW